MFISTSPWWAISNFQKTWIFLYGNPYANFSGMSVLFGTEWYEESVKCTGLLNSSHCHVSKMEWSIGVGVGCCWKEPMCCVCWKSLNCSNGVSSLPASSQCWAEKNGHRNYLAYSKRIECLCWLKNIYFTILSIDSVSTVYQCIAPLFRYLVSVETRLSIKRNIHRCLSLRHIKRRNLFVPIVVPIVGLERTRKKELSGIITLPVWSNSCVEYPN